MPDDERYEVFAIRYGRRDTRKSEVYLNYGVYSEPDMPVAMDYYVSGRTDVLPGIRLIEVGGHTPGHLIGLVQTASGQAVLACDALHYYEELDRDRPFAIVSDLRAMYEGFDTLAELAADPGRVLVARHDPDVMTRFPGVGGAEGVAVRIG